MDLRILIESSESPAQAPSPYFDASGPSITIDGRVWRLSRSLDVSNQSSWPPFTCVSFTWGPGRMKNPFQPGRLMSDKTIPAFTAAIRHHFHSRSAQDTHSAAFWIDSLCIPDTQPNRHATLHSMGFIYSCASAIIVTLSGQIGTLLYRMISDRNCVLTEDELQIAETDKWVTSVWTYQEAANSKGHLVFVAMDDGNDHETVTAGVSSGRGVSVSNFLSCIGYSLMKYAQKNNFTPFDVRNKFPRMDALEDLTADILATSSRSALQAMSNIDRRICAIERPENRIYSMIGVITQSPYDDIIPYAGPRSGLDPTIPELAESFMRECDRKGDFSYIYSSAERDDIVGRRWRPKAGDIPSILLCHSYGSGQGGHYDTRGFWLDDVHCIDVLGSATMGEAGRQKILHWLGYSGSLMSDTDVTEKLGRHLKEYGFTGSFNPITTSHGFFFPQTTIHPDASAQSEYIIIIPSASSLGWAFGHPALARVSTNAVDGGDSAISFIAGVFAGKAPDTAASSVLLDPTALSSAQ